MTKIREKEDIWNMSDKEKRYIC